MVRQVIARQCADRIQAQQSTNRMCASVSRRSGASKFCVDALERLLHLGQRVLAGVVHQRQVLGSAAFGLEAAQRAEKPSNIQASASA